MNDSAPLTDIGPIKPISKNIPNNGALVAFYNTDNYESPESAKQDGAFYEVSSDYSASCVSGMCDLSEIVAKLIECIGVKGSFVCVILCDDDRWHPLDEISVDGDKIWNS